MNWKTKFWLSLKQEFLHQLNKYQLSEEDCTFYKLRDISEILYSFILTKLHLQRSLQIINQPINKYISKSLHYPSTLQIAH